MIEFRIQGTPNPKARKYVIEIDFKATGRVSYKSAEECKHIPLAQDLFSIPGITQLHFFQNTLTVTQDGRWDWADLDEHVQNIVTKALPKHDANFVDDPNKDEPDVKPQFSDPTMKKIDEILDQMIRPSLQMDGGDIELVELEDNILTVRYMGACGGCPSAMSGTLEAIRSILRDEIDENLEIVTL